MKTLADIPHKERTEIHHSLEYDRVVHQNRNRVIQFDKYLAYNSYSINTDRFTKMSNKKFVHLTPLQKKEIIAQFERNSTEKTHQSYQSIAEWAAEKFQLNKIPNASTICRIIRNQSISKGRGKTVKSKQLENELRSWIWKMHEQGTAVTDAIIQEKAINLFESINRKLPSSNGMYMKFSNGWLWRFKKRNKFKRAIPHDEIVDIHVSQVIQKLPIIRK